MHFRNATTHQNNIKEAKPSNCIKKIEEVSMKNQMAITRSDGEEGVVDEGVGAARMPTDVERRRLEDEEHNERVARQLQAQI